MRRPPRSTRPDTRFPHRTLFRSGLERMLTANDYEAGIIEQRTGRGRAEIASTLDAVVVTRGARGATLYADGVETAIDPVEPDDVVDPTGCGDAHRAGL